MGTHEVSRSSTSYFDKGWQTITDTAQLQSSITSASALAIQSGGKLDLTATMIKAKGDAQLLATGDITLGTALASHNDSGKFGKRAIITWDNTSVSNVVTDINVGGDLLMNTGKGEAGLSLAEKTGAVTSLGASIHTDGQSYLYGNEINLLAVKDASRNISTQTKKKSFAGITYSSSKSSSSSLQEWLNSSDLIAGDDVGLMSRNDINLIAANVSGENVSPLTGTDGSGNLNILGEKAVSETLTTWEKSRLRLSASGMATPGSMGIGAPAQETKGGANGQRTEAYVGSTVKATGNVLLKAPDALNVTGSSVSAGGQLTARATDIMIGAGMATQSSSNSDYETYQSLVANQKAHQVGTTTSTHATGSMLSGAAIDLGAAHDVSVMGSQVVADNDVVIRAGNNVTIGTVTETTSQTSIAKSTKNGVFGEGLSVTLGQQKQSLEQLAQQNTEVGSVVGTSAGKVSVQDGGDYTQRASDVIGTGGITVTAQNISVEAGKATYQSEMHERQRQAGFTQGISSPVLTAAKSAEQSYDRSKEVQDERLQKVLQAKAALESAKAVQEAQKALAAGPDQAFGVKVSASVGASSSRSDSVSSGTQSIGSSLQSGGDIALRATGNGEAGSGDLGVAGSQISGNNVSLSAADALMLQSAQNTSSDRSSNKSSGGSVGLGISAGANGLGLSLDIAAQIAKGKTNGDSLSHTESVISAANQLALSSGGDTTLKGAQASGEQITANVGDNLNLESQQDKSTYDSQQKSGGVGLSIPILGTTASASGYYSQDKLKSDYLSVQEQTGLYAGNGGFDINVGGNTDLKGAVIASTAEGSKNTHSTDTLTHSNLQNTADWSAKSAGFSASTDMVSNPLAMGMAALGTAANTLGGGNDGDHQTGTTQSAIGAATIIVRQDVQTGEDSTEGLSRDTATANAGALTNTFDEQALREQQELVQVFGQVGFQLVGDLSTYMEWKEGSPEKIALHGLVGYLQTKFAGGNPVAGMTAAMANEWMTGQLKATSKNPPFQSADATQRVARPSEPFIFLKTPC